MALWQAAVIQAWQGKRTVAEANGTSLHCVLSQLTGVGKEKKGKEEACLLHAKTQSFSPCRRSRLSLAFQLPCKRLSCTSKFFEKPRSDFSLTREAESSGRLRWSNIMTWRFRYNLWCLAIYFKPQTPTNDGSRQFWTGKLHPWDRRAKNAVQGRVVFVMHYVFPNQNKDRAVRQWVILVNVIFSQPAIEENMFYLVYARISWDFSEFPTCKDWKNEHVSTLMTMILMTILLPGHLTAWQWNPT